MVKCKYRRELRLGTQIELEHTKSLKRAAKIASDHLKEFKCYYSQGLIPLEKRLKRMQK
jgi:hypothetical protein